MEEWLRRHQWMLVRTNHHKPAVTIFTELDSHNRFGTADAWKLMKVHRRLNERLAKIKHPVTGNSMLPSRYNKGDKLRATCLRSDRLNAMSRFYCEHNGVEYWEYFKVELREIVKYPSLFK